MSETHLLTTASLAGDWSEVWSAGPASHAGLLQASALLVPHDGLPAADVQGQPERWALLNLITEALRRDLPILAWGSGAALVGRALGARVHGRGIHGAEVDWSALPRGAVALQWRGSVPLYWTLNRVVAWADVDLPGDLRHGFLSRLPAWTSRTPATPLEQVGGAEALRALLVDFYARARADDLIGPTFAAHVHDWDAHLERVTAFWATMLGGGVSGGAMSGGGGWRGNLNAAHAGLGLRAAHLERWLRLWQETVRERFEPAAAQVLISRAQQMSTRLTMQAAARHGNLRK